MLKTVLKSVKYNIIKFLIEKVDILFENIFFLDICYKEPALKAFFKYLYVIFTFKNLTSNK